MAKGQYNVESMPRFGLPEYANRFPDRPERLRIEIDGAVERPVTLDAAKWRRLPRHEQESDFHCVTTWCAPRQHWEGVCFRSFHERFVVPECGPHDEVSHVAMRCADGFRAVLPLEDMLAEDVLLADRHNRAPLTLAHGAPLRLVAPAHYGYKNAKHVVGIELLTSEQRPDSLRRRFLTHPRARVAREERSGMLPGWLLRRPYRALIPRTIRNFERALQQYERERARES